MSVFDKLSLVKNQSESIQNDLVSVVFTLRDELLRLATVSKELLERIVVLEEMFEEQGESEIDESETPNNTESERSNNIEVEEIKINYESEDDVKTPRTVRFDWQKHREEVLINQVSGNPPEVGVKYTDLEHDLFLRNGYDLARGIRWLKWYSDDQPSWWEIARVKR